MKRRVCQQHVVPLVHARAKYVEEEEIRVTVNVEHEKMMMSSTNDVDAKMRMMKRKRRRRWWWSVSVRVNDHGDDHPLSEMRQLFPCPNEEEQSSTRRWP
jgi:hypothetical protein